MKLYLKRDTFNQLARFVVFNELGKEKYFIVNSQNYSHRNMAVTDVNFQQLCTIHSIPLPLLNAYTINDRKDTIRLIFNKNTSRLMCYYYGISWRIRGDILGKNYEIVDNDNKILLTHSGRTGSIPGGSEINIYDESRELLLLASVACADIIETNNEKQLQTV